MAVCAVPGTTCVFCGSSIGCAHFIVGGGFCPLTHVEFLDQAGITGFYRGRICEVRALRGCGIAPKVLAVESWMTSDWES